MLSDPNLQPFSCITTHSAPNGRRLYDKMLVAFHQACDQGELDLANTLISLVEKILWQDRACVGLDRRRRLANLVAAYERLWFLRHAGEDSLATMEFAAANN